MDKYECPCGYVYDPEEGDYEHNVDSGTGWDELPEDWLCPKCDSEQEFFEQLDD
jgi:rubredoxin